MKHRLISILIMALAMTAVLGGCRKKHQATDATESAVTETATEETYPDEETSETEEETEAETETEVESGEAESEDEQVTESATDDIISSENGTEDPTGNHAGTDGNSGTAIAPETAVSKIVTGVSAKANGSYYVGDTLGAADFTVTVTYSDGTTATNPAGYGVAPLTLAGSSNTLTVSYGGVENTFVVKASERPTEMQAEETTEGLIGRSTPVESWMVGTWKCYVENPDGGIDSQCQYWIEIYENGKANYIYSYFVDVGEPDYLGDGWFSKDDWGYLDDNNCLVLDSGRRYQVESISSVIFRVNGDLYIRQAEAGTEENFAQFSLLGTEWTSVSKPAFGSCVETIVIDQDGRVTDTKVWSNRVCTYVGNLCNGTYYYGGKLVPCYSVVYDSETTEVDGEITYSGEYRSTSLYKIFTLADDTIRGDWFYIRTK